MVLARNQVPGPFDAIRRATSSIEFAGGRQIMALTALYTGHRRREAWGYCRAVGWARFSSDRL